MSAIVRPHCHRTATLTAATCVCVWVCLWVCRRRCRCRCRCHRVGQGLLYRILTAFANLDRRVGYCQGMNFVAGLLLLVGMNEPDAFYTFTSLMLRYAVTRLPVCTAACHGDALAVWR